MSNASCEISTVGLLVIGSRSKLSRRCRPKVSSTERSSQAIDVEVLELAAEHSPTRVLSSFVEGDEAEEHLAGDLVRLVTEAGQQSFGALHQRARHPADLF